jgi:hypothetical protein
MTGCRIIEDCKHLSHPQPWHRTGSFLQPKCQRLKPHAAPEENEKSSLSETRSTMQSGSLFRLLMIGCVGEVARGASGTAESSQRLSASLRRMTRESPARIRAATAPGDIQGSWLRFKRRASCKLANASTTTRSACSNRCARSGFARRLPLPKRNGEGLNVLPPPA